ncbi:group II intron maturase-specific domain-containing protein [Limnospira sp. PMC 1042.18]|uniref:group II intron maturase-specific domain-containing protein n=2 Tax=Limnospira TaxID=2596745 RepID=UPI001E40BBDF|nr:group II intron maturase-specific domain-containing protein [Limnospira sp. PMC 1042.18]MDT9198280.1 group II intron maturase-specific domain-containing protein [Limnospira sp. PMC 1042.18]
MKKTKASLIGTRMVCVDESLLTVKGEMKGRRNCWQRGLWKLQQRIYRASKRGEIKVVRKLQKMLCRSASVRYLASDICDGGSIAVQECLMQWALEPEWRARWELDDDSSFGVSSVGELLQAIAQSLENGPKFVWVVDLARLGQPRILAQRLPDLPRFMALNKARIDGALGCFLDAIALVEFNHQLSRLIREQTHPETTLIRFGEIMVILDGDMRNINIYQKAVSEWLDKWEISPVSDFYAVTNTANCVDENSPGVDLLGFHIRQFKNHHRRGLNYHTTISPSRESAHQHYRELAAIVSSHKASRQGDLINLLNRKIEDWSGQYQWANNRKIHRNLDRLINQKLRSWAKRRHPDKPINYWRRKYWQGTETGGCRFGCFHKGKWVSLLKHRV